MKKPAFMEGVVVALVASILGSAIYTTLTAISVSDWVPRALIAGIGFGYVIYLLSRSNERVGRITTLATWATLAGANWLLEPSLPVYVVIHVGLIWIVRSLYFYSSIVAALTDLGLSGLSLAAAIWAAHHSGSVFLTVWCFFLLQALFVHIPTQFGRHVEPDREDLEGAHRFERAYHVAETALRKLSSIR